MNETRAGSHRLVKFGVFEVDLRSGELRKSGARVSLWPDDTFVDFDHGVSAVVKRLRQALGDSADSPPLCRNGATARLSLS
jgi:hypothetical protein